MSEAFFLKLLSLHAEAAWELNYENQILDKSHTQHVMWTLFMHADAENGKKSMNFLRVSSFSGFYWFFFFAFIQFTVFPYFLT